MSRTTANLSIDSRRISTARGHETILSVRGAKRARGLGQPKRTVKALNRSRCWTKHIHRPVVVRAGIQIGTKPPHAYSGRRDLTRSLLTHRIGDMLGVQGVYRGMVGIRRIRQRIRRHTFACVGPDAGRGVRNILLTAGAGRKANDQNQDDCDQNHPDGNTNLHYYTFNARNN